MIEFFGLTNGNTCRCGNGFGFSTNSADNPNAAAASCRVPASGNAAQAGGASNAMVVWRYYTPSLDTNPVSEILLCACGV
jgi:hypothetical protein